jgi:hypothetical protein
MLESQPEAGVLLCQRLQYLDAGRYHFGTDAVSGNRRNFVCFH